MYAGGLLATLLLLGIVLIVTLLAVVISEPHQAAPRTRENPADITRRLNTAGGRRGKREGKGSDRVKG